MSPHAAWYGFPRQAFFPIWLLLLSISNLSHRRRMCLTRSLDCLALGGTFTANIESKQNIIYQISFFGSKHKVLVMKQELKVSENPWFCHRSKSTWEQYKGPPYQIPNQFWPRSSRICEAQGFSSGASGKSFCLTHRQPQLPPQRRNQKCIYD